MKGIFDEPLHDCRFSRLEKEREEVGDAHCLRIYDRFDF
jgi:hypothetical protein